MNNLYFLSLLFFPLTYEREEKKQFCFGQRDTCFVPNDSRFSDNNRQSIEIRIEIDYQHLSSAS